ncbi:MAG: hypothetical protein DRN71_02925 [Candidatus Nanohalarchaeota archaeon]|nr:MAG: hypothetical protein DRN71_02925 [Candidatus Nanohaloarchaeota archaeon]
MPKTSERKGGCAYCHKKFDEYPFTCKFCGNDYCSDHRLPENHECIGLEKYKEKQVNSLTEKKPARPIEYFYHKHEHITTPKKKPMMPYIIISTGIFLMISAHFTHMSMYYIGFILICAGLIKLFMPRTSI